MHVWAMTIHACVSYDYSCMCELWLFMHVWAMTIHACVSYDYPCMCELWLWSFACADLFSDLDVGACVLKAHRTSNNMVLKLPAQRQGEGGGGGKGGYGD